MDSVVLLHALSRLRQEQYDWQLRAIHVNHQLQIASTSWAQQCLDWSAELQVPCEVVTVDVINSKDQGTEAAARDARYFALKAALKPNEVLLTAHHADDQFETMLIALMRGAGLNGLAAMPTLKSFGHAWHARPLLGFTRDQLQAWAQQQSLPYISDPTNDHTHYDRNYLRHAVIPQIKQRWPAAAVTSSRAASHLSETKMLLDQFVAQDYFLVHHQNTIDIAALAQLSSARRKAVIRYWLQHHEVLMPSTNVLLALEHDIFNSADDRIPCTRWGEYAVHRYNNRLYLEKYYRLEVLNECLQWNWTEPLQLPYDLGSLSLTTSSSTDELPRHPISSLRLKASSLPTQLMVRFRQGGENLQLPNNKSRELRKLFNDAGVLPWWRGRIPLLYAGDELIAVAGLWVCASFVADEIQPTLQFKWSPPEAMMFGDK